ncbi:MAG: cytochrome c, mono- and diheme variant family [Acidobacteriaceae bacterium]|nr:cytochrome c, mono- and diheme variant family [Acidobacteriaceae bacterium]
MHLFWKISLPLAACMTIVALAYAQSPRAATPPPSRPTVGSQGALPVHEVYAPDLIASGGSLFQQNCAFCHGRDAGGGESGPDLTRSKLVSTDTKGENIGPIVRNGRIEKGMPRFNLGEPELKSLVAFIHSQQDKAMSQTGTRKGVDVSDLQTGNLEEGKKYFNGAGTCSKCHSPTGDLAGIATKYQGLRLEQQMLYPRDAKSKVSVTPASGKTLSGVLAFQDEFTIALVDQDGVYHSWNVSDVKFKVDAPVKAHVELFDKYTDADIHNLMAYVQTLR